MQIPAKAEAYKPTSDKLYLQGIFS